MFRCVSRVFLVAMIGVFSSNPLLSLQKQDINQVSLMKLLELEKIRPVKRIQHQAFLCLVQTVDVDPLAKVANRIRGLDKVVKEFRTLNEEVAIVDLWMNEKKHQAQLIGNQLSYIFDKNPDIKKRLGKNNFDELRRIQMIVSLMDNDPRSNVSRTFKDVKLAEQIVRLAAKRQTNFHQLFELYRASGRVKNKCVKGMLFEMTYDAAMQLTQRLVKAEIQLLGEAVHYFQQIFDYHKAAKILDKMVMFAAVKTVSNKVRLDAIRMWALLGNNENLAQHVRDHCLIQTTCSKAMIDTFADSVAQRGNPQLAVELYQDYIQKNQSIDNAELAFYLAQIGVLTGTKGKLDQAYSYIKDTKLTKQSRAFIQLARYEAKGIQRSLGQAPHLLSQKHFKLEHLSMIEKKVEELLLTKDSEVSVLSAYYTGQWYQWFFHHLDQQSFFKRLFSYNKRKMIKEKMGFWYQMAYKFYTASEEKLLIKEGQLAYAKLHDFWPKAYPQTKLNKTQLYAELIPNLPAIEVSGNTHMEPAVTIWKFFQEGAYKMVLKSVILNPQLVQKDQKVRYMAAVSLIKLGYYVEAAESVKALETSLAYYIKALAFYFSGSYQNAVEQLNLVGKKPGKSLRVKAGQLKKRLYESINRYDLAFLQLGPAPK